MSAPPTPTPTPRPRRKGVHWAYFVTTTVIAAAAAGAAVGLGLQAVKINDDYLATQDDAAQRRRGLTFQAVTNTMWGVAAAAAVTATVLVFITRWRAEKAEPTVTIAPTLGPGQLGLSIQLRR